MHEPSLLVLRSVPLQRNNSTSHRGRCVWLTAGETRQRVAAAEGDLCSAVGRASSTITPPASAASCNRRVAAMSSPLPSATTTDTPPHRA
ncbi:MAG: hypothetical protein WD118_05730, partial [Phycisphaeraceae bacterium]